MINLNKLLRISAFIVSVIITIILVLDKSLPKGLEYFPLVPLTFGVFYVFAKKVTFYMFNNIGLLALNIALVIRYIITPFFMWYNGHSIGRGAVPSEGDYQIAVFLMVLEIIVIFLTISLFADKYYKKDKRVNNIKENKNLIGTCFLVITSFIILIFPSLLESYSFVLTANEYTNDVDLNLPLGSLFPLMVRFAIMLLTVSIINLLYKVYNLRPMGVLVYLSVFVVFIISSFIVGTSRFSVLLPMATGMYVVIRLYPLYRKKVYSISGILLLIVVSISTLVKQFGISIGENTSDMAGVTTSMSSSLQVYFSGVHNVAIAVKAKEIFGNDIGVSNIIGDLLYSVALLSDYFASDFGAVRMFNYAFYEHTNSTDQILPMIGQGYLYFGFFFSPFFVVIFTLLMMYFDKKSREGKTVFEVYIYTYVAVRFGLFFMSNATILTSFFTNYFLLLLLIILLNKKIVLYKKQNTHLKPKGLSET